MGRDKYRVLKIATACAVLLTVVALVYVLLNGEPGLPGQQRAGEMKTAELNSYNPEEVNGYLFREATLASILVRKYIEEDRLEELWAAAEGGKEANVLIVYNIPESKKVWREISYWMPGNVKHPYSPDLVRFTEDALKNGACVANITNVQGDIVICVGVNRDAALNAIRAYAVKNIKCSSDNNNCAINAVDGVLHGDPSATEILYVGENGKVLKIYSHKKKVLTIWYGRNLVNYIVNTERE